MTKSEIRELIESHSNSFNGRIYNLKDLIDALHRKMVEELIKENEKYRVYLQDYNPKIGVFLKNASYEEGLKTRQSDINFMVYNRLAALRKELENG